MNKEKEDKIRNDIRDYVFNYDPFVVCSQLGFATYHKTSLRTISRFFKEVFEEYKNIGNIKDYQNLKIGEK